MKDVKFQFLYKGLPWSGDNDGVNWHKKVYTLDSIISKPLSKLCDAHGICELIAKRQYTGIKDNCGAEIYYGDILTVMINETKMMDSDKADEYFSPFIKAKSGKFYTGKRIASLWTVEHVDHLTYTGAKVYGLNRRFNKPLTNSVICNSCAEVVGNIYENPELLA